MTIAVALATYNGERFLQEQLDSLASQSRLPDQLVIRDDGSTDTTLDIIEAFKRTAPFPVEVLPGGEKLGPTMNFLTAAQACSADYVAFCDQDDIWLPTKLERCEAALKASGACLAIHSIEDFRLVEGNRVREDVLKMPMRTVDGRCYLHSKLLPGMGMVARTSVLKSGLSLRERWIARLPDIIRSRPISNHDLWSQMHDAYIVTVARVAGSIVFLSSTLALHRTHESNVSKQDVWQQPSEVAELWGRGRGVSHRVMSHFCGDFAALIRDGAATSIASETRCEQVADVYERWAAIWLARSKLLADDASISGRLTSYREAIALGAYRSEYAGGMGHRSFVKDTLNVFGMKVG